MGTFSIWHWIIVLAVVLLLFGGRGKISQIMGDFGKGLKSFKRSMREDEPFEDSEALPRAEGVAEGRSPRASDAAHERRSRRARNGARAYGKPPRAPWSMFDIGWQELFLIGVVALIVVGPKDLPKVLRSAAALNKARAMSREFQAGLAEMARRSNSTRSSGTSNGPPASISGEELRSAVDPTGQLSAEFDPAEFNRKLKGTVEASPPARYPLPPVRATRRRCQTRRHESPSAHVSPARCLRSTTQSCEGAANRPR